MHDPDWSTGTEKVLRVRIDEFVRRLGVELLVVDEIQHLRREGNDVNDVTDALKRWLDVGSVPLVLVGNMDSQPFFERNKQLRSEEHTSELKSLMRISYAVFCLKKKTNNNKTNKHNRKRKTKKTQITRTNIKLTEN